MKVSSELVKGHRVQDAFIRNVVNPISDVVVEAWRLGPLEKGFPSKR